MIKHTVDGKELRLRAPPRRLPPRGEGGRRAILPGCTERGKTLDYHAPYQPESIVDRAKMVKIFMGLQEVHRSKLRKGVDILRKRTKAKESKLNAVEIV